MTGQFARILALNNAHATELSWLGPDRLERLIERAFHVQTFGDVDAFLLAFDQAADYDSPNFLWFRARLARFVYIDRIVVSRSARGRGHARRLYEELFDKARSAGHDCVTCEVNSDPPNPASDAFHTALGFVEVGGTVLAGGAKTVRYLRRSLRA